MTVKMSSEGDSSKNLSSESNEKNEAENTDSSQDAKDAKPDAATENSVEKKEEDAKPKEAPNEASDEADKKPETDKSATDKVENAKGDTKPSEKKEEKTKAKEKDEEENSEQEDEKSEDGGDDEKDVPLLDQPLEKSGKRERKNVQRFNEEFPSETKEVVKVEIPNGSGTSLGAIPRIDASISRFKNEDMRLLHKILFKLQGKVTMIKKNIKKFNGFEFKKGSEEYSKKVASMTKCDVKQLKSICEMLDLQKTGSKDDIVERILDFLLEPKDSGKPVGGGRPKRTAAVRANNRGYSSHDNYSSDERNSGSSSASDEDFEPSDEGSDEKPTVKKRKRVDRKKIDSEDEEESDMESATSDEDSDFQEEPKSKRRKTAKANNKNKGKGTGKRGRPPTKKTTKAGKKKNKDSSEEDEEEEEESEQKEASSSSEDEPLVKKAAKSAQPPTDDEIKTYVKEILEGANLEQITMKTVCQQVYAHYPDFDLAHKKDFIKSTVKSLIST
ncbi:protein DEK isoform X2 [Tribolium castaneum]|nr:PREDICTED: protein DEK isoform X2 [Tribolium castaneum]|eukprot:XP_008196366.1 PREDICTED: protein DEK isoform X2 [Tribolium castaneum]